MQGVDAVTEVPPSLLPSTPFIKEILAQLTPQDTHRHSVNKHKGFVLCVNSAAGNQTPSVVR